MVSSCFDPLESVEGEALQALSSSRPVPVLTENFSFKKGRWLNQRVSSRERMILFGDGVTRACSAFALPQKTTIPELISTLLNLFPKHICSIPCIGHMKIGTL